MLKIQDGGCIVCAEDKCCWYPCQDHDLDPGSVFVVGVLVFCRLGLERSGDSSLN